MSSIIKRLNNPLNRFLFAMAMVEFVTVLVNCQWRVRSYNTTMLALDYKNGFTSRALLGTLYHRLNDVLPFNIISYKAVCVFAVLVTGVLACLLLFFSKKLLEKTNSRSQMKMQVLLLFFSVLVMSTFSCGYNLLRVDEFMLATSLTAVLLLVTEKAEWLVVLLSAVGVMFHQGYVFMYFNIILVALFIKVLDAQSKKKKWYYVVLFLLSFLVGSVLFLYFELYSRTAPNGVYERVLSDAVNMSYHGIYHSTLLAHEVLGIDLGDTERVLRMVNRIQLPIFIICVLPYLVLLLGVLGSMVKQAKEGSQKLKYVIVMLGSFTMLPDFLLKVDYGRWIMAVVSYYMVMLCFLLVREDVGAETALSEIAKKLKEKPMIFLFFIYPILLIPYWDVDICESLRVMNCWLVEIISDLGGNVYDYFNWY